MQSHGLFAIAKLLVMSSFNFQKVDYVHFSAANVVSFKVVGATADMYLVNTRSGRKWTGSGPVTSLIWTRPDPDRISNTVFAFVRSLFVGLWTSKMTLTCTYHSTT